MMKKLKKRVLLFLFAAISISSSYAASAFAAAVAEHDEVITADADVVSGSVRSFGGINASKYGYSVDVFFDFDKDVLGPDSKQALDELLHRMGNMKHVEVVVLAGYTDSTGTTKYNEELSLHRAEAVKTYLVERGVPSNLIYIESRGEAEPVADNRTRQGRALNNRVEIEAILFRQH